MANSQRQLAPDALESAPDVTDGKALQQTLACALADVTDAVITASCDDRVTYMNAAAERITRLRSQDAVGERLSEVLSIVDTRTGAAIDKALDAVRHDEQPRKLAQNAVVLDGPRTPLIIEYTVSAVRDSQGRMIGSTTVFREIMRPWKSEECQPVIAAAAFDEEERAHVTLNSMGDAVISTDFRGRITFMNVIAEKMTGWSLAEAAGRPLDEIVLLVDTATREKLKSPATQAIIGNQPESLETTRVLIRKDGIELAVEDTATPILDNSGGVVGAVMVAHDVTAAREQADRFERLAMHDALTGLPNRSLLADRLNQTVERILRKGGNSALLFIDLDRFKPVNDLLGHPTGDQLLQLAAARLLSCVRSSDTVSRFGGDEFVVMLPDVAHAEDAAKCAQKILAALNQPFNIDGQNVQIGASIGIATCPGDAPNPALLIEYADAAMYRAKSNGRNTFIFFDPAQ